MTNVGTTNFRAPKRHNEKRQNDKLTKVGMFTNVESDKLNLPHMYLMCKEFLTCYVSNALG